MPDRLDYLRCRDIGHHWEEDFPLDRRKPAWGTRRILRCRFCDTERIEIIDIGGDVSTRHYTYNNGYRRYTKLSKSEARMKRMRTSKRKLLILQAERKIGE